MSTSREINRHLPRQLQVTLQDIDDLEEVWQLGFGAVVWRVNRIAKELFPQTKGILLNASAPPSQRALQYYYDLFVEALPAALRTSIPSGIQLVSSRDKRPRSKRSLLLSDGERVLPWCIGLSPIGAKHRNLDLDYAEISRKLRTSNHSAEWFEENVTRPMEAQAHVWHFLFESWRRATKIHCEPPSNLTKNQRDIWNVLDEAGRRLTAQLIGKALAKKHLPQGSGGMRQTLSHLIQLKVLTNRADTKPRGYGLAAWG